MQIYVYIDPAAAVRAGKARSGVIAVEMGEADIAALTQEQRELLAQCDGLGCHTEPGADLVGQRYSGRAGSGLELIEATPASVAAWLAAVLEAERAKAAEAAAERARTLAGRVAEAEQWLACLEAQSGPALAALPDHESKPPYYSSPDSVGEDLASRISAVVGRAAAGKKQMGAAREAEWMAENPARALVVESVVEGRVVAAAPGGHYTDSEAMSARRRDAFALAAAQNEALDTGRDAAISAAVAEWGTESQRARRGEGLLPDAEVLDMVRESLFGAIDVLRYGRLDEADVEHTDECAGPDVEFSAPNASSLDDRQYATLGRIRAAAPEGATVTPRVHRGHCDECYGTTESKTSALVRLDWHGFRLSREYAL